MKSLDTINILTPIIDKHAQTIIIFFICIQNCVIEFSKITLRTPSIFSLNVYHFERCSFQTLIMFYYHYDRQFISIRFVLGQYMTIRIFTHNNFYRCRDYMCISLNYCTHYFRILLYQFLMCRTRNFCLIRKL